MDSWSSCDEYWPIYWLDVQDQVLEANLFTILKVKLCGIIGFWKGQWLHEGAATIKVIHVTLQYILSPQASDLILFSVFRE